MKATFLKRSNGRDEFAVESASNPGEPREVFLGNFAYCSCPKFRKKMGLLGPVGIDDTAHQCQHIGAAKAEQARLGLTESNVAVIRECFICHAPGAEYECCDEGGHETVGFIHIACVPRAKYNAMRNEGNRDTVQIYDYAEELADDYEEGEPEWVANDLPMVRYCGEVMSL